MTTSENGIKLIKWFEKFMKFPYNDEGGNSTIGYGTLLHRGPVDLKANTIDMLYANGVDEEEADRMLRTHANIMIDVPFQQLLKIAVAQNQYDAMGSLAYNIGLQNFKTSTLLRLVNAGSLDLVPSQFLRWDKEHKNGQVVESQGLESRRVIEARLFEKGIYPAEIL